MKNLTVSQIERGNILNNNFAVKELYESLGFVGVMFEGKYRFTRNMVINYFAVEERTIDRYLNQYSDELTQNGYEVLTGFRLKQFKGLHVTDINVGDMVEDTENQLVNEKAPSIGVFTFKAFLNLGMLLTESTKAKELRSFILNIVIDVLNKKMGGSTKYINQREEEFLPSAIREYNYRQEYTNALDNYIEPNKFKYSQLTDKIYVSIFKEKSKEYRQVLNLSNKESVRSTMYSEVLDLISSYENGFADYLKREFEKSQTKIKLSEANSLFKQFEQLTEKIYEPLREKARTLMAGRDMAFRDALHEKLAEYVDVVKSEDFQKFLGEKSKTLEDRLEENKDVFIRLKDR
jgi:BMFP domain-containing protein YqiC